MSGAGKVVFAGGGDFQTELRRRAAELLTPARVRRGRRRASLKAVVIMSWALGSYLGLLLFARQVWMVAPLALSLGLALAGIGFAIAHDANHGALLRGRRRNRILGLSFDLIGASSYVWRTKHNGAHHSFTNVVGADADIDQLPLLRLAPDQARRRFHRWQHLYAWPIYGLFALRHHLVGDVVEVARGRVGGITPLARPRGLELALFVGGKVVFWAWALAVPLLVAPWWAVLATFLTCSWVVGFTLATVFQLAHAVEEAAFSSVERLRAGPAPTWAVHQVESTVDFATGNRLLGWYLGGLNFQIEHHLFPRVCHVHHAHLLEAVRETCIRHGVRHVAQPSLGAALASHGRWLRRMGRFDLGVGPEAIHAMAVS
ncbi:MAG: linoleoyl-CoA desaturase [Miltoncostaeaceae bacterium]|jgi:linoleoyl-CoA desaturase|nr:linoleoyl-CoA desaturase [Miltoncostaeaceae bacterium]